MQLYIYTLIVNSLLVELRQALHYENRLCKVRFCIRNQLNLSNLMNLNIISGDKENSDINIWAIKIPGG